MLGRAKRALDRRLGLGLVGFSLAIAGCGGGEGETTTASDSADGTFTQQPEAAADPSADLFPPANGETLKQLAAKARPGLIYAPGTQTYEPGENRVAFGLLNRDNQIIYAPTAVYVAPTPNDRAKGPFLAPADTLVTEAPYRSQNAAADTDPFASVYAADIPLPNAGSYTALVLAADSEGQLLGSTARYEVKASTSVPSIGDTAPVTDTDTADEVGNIAEIDTRVPPDSMHDTNLADVVGEKPVALLFATPALCQSRVCGPVTDIAEQLKTEYGGEIEFIHQEVYVDNDPAKGLRPSLLDYRLSSEPWLFTLDADGKIADRLEGSFGVNAFEEAVQQAIG